MKILNSGNILRLPLDQIVVGKRLRKVSESQVATLLLMAEDTGITTPIHVRKVGAGYELIDGAHRLEATRRMGLDDIATLVVECRQDEARAMEASNNLGAARMTPVQTAIFAASWKRDYYEMHPERKQGVFKGNQHSGKVVGDTMSLTKSIADSFGIGERQAHRILAIGEKLSPDEASMLDAAPKPVALKDLADMAKISEPSERLRVVHLMSLGEVKSASEARRRVAAENPDVQVVVKDPIDEAFKALSALWARAPKAAKRRFAEDHADELARLIDGGADAE